MIAENLFGASDIKSEMAGAPCRKFADRTGNCGCQRGVELACDLAKKCLLRVDFSGGEVEEPCRFGLDHVEYGACKCLDIDG